jgi:hypothetical protein
VKGGEIRYVLLFRTNLLLSYDLQEDFFGSRYPANQESIENLSFLSPFNQFNNYTGIGSGIKIRPFDSWALTALGDLNPYALKMIDPRLDILNIISQMVEALPPVSQPLSVYRVAFLNINDLDKNVTRPIKRCAARAGIPS